MQRTAESIKAKLAPLLLACATLGSPSAVALNPERQLSQYVHTAWKSESGLQAVRRLKQTPDGYLWLATRGGLVRFDGVRFTTYLAGSVPGIESSTMQDLLVDPDGSLWAATLGGGVIHYQSGTFRTYTMRDGLPSDDIASLYRDKSGVLWLGTRGGAIARMRQGRFESAPLAIPSGPVSAFMEDDDHSMWIASYGNGVFHLRNGVLTEFTVKDGIPDTRVTGLCRERSGKLWTAGWNGLTWWNGTRFVPEPVANSTIAYAIGCTEDRHGNLWVGSSSGLYRIRSGKVTRMNQEGGLSGDFVSDVFEDREGNLWAGTRTGLDRFRDGRIRTFLNGEGSIADAGPIVADQRSGIWTVSTSKIAHISANETTVWPLALPRGNLPITLVPHGSGGFLIGFNGGAMSWAAQHSAFEPDLKGLDVRCLLKARDGSIWIGAANRGLLHWKPSQALPETRLEDKFIATLAEDHSGTIWAGSVSGGGLYRIAGQQVQNFSRNQGLRSPNVYTLYVDDKGVLWIGSSSGLSWFDNGLRTVSSQQGLSSDQVFAIVDDTYDRLWFSSHGGVTSIEKKALTEWASGQRARLTPTVYRSADGLHATYTINRVFPIAARSSDGHLWFTTADGVSEVTPPNPGESRSGAFQVFVEDVKVDGVPNPPQSHLRIPPGVRSIQLDYTALTLSSPETVRFRYRLEGIDSDWVQADSRRFAFYNNLKPDAYKFRVSASTGEDQWHEAPMLTLEQLPFFYQTSWFMVLASAAVLSLAFFAYRYRVQQAVDRLESGFQQRMEERTRIAQELHDTVVQAISGSTMLVENAAEKVPDSLPVVKGALLRAVDRLDAALNESRAALKGLRGSSGLDNNLASQLAAVASDANNNDVKFKLVITGDARQLRPVIQYEVFRIASEAICNAFKHSSATSIRVEVGYLNDLRISVQDNGKGIPDDVLRHGREGHFGLEGMRERADRIGAKLEVFSRVAEGTEVVLAVPANLAFDSSRNENIAKP